MSIQAKKENLLRVGGMVLILVGLVFSIILAYLNLGNFFLYLSFLIITLPFLAFSICLKLEKRLIVENRFKILILLSVLSTILSIIFLIVNFHDSKSLRYVFLTFTNFLILIFWHFSLSIYKKEKIIYTIAGSGAITFYFIIYVDSYLSQSEWYLNLIVLVILSLGFSSIIISERMMVRKGLLKYV